MSRLGTLSFVVLAASAVASAETPPGPPLTLRLRDVALSDVVFVLYQVTGQGYVVDEDVAGRVDIELAHTSADDVERRLVAMGLAFSGPGPLRRVSTRPMPPLPRPSSGHTATLQFRAQGDLRDLLELFQDAAGTKVLAPAGPLGRFVLFANDLPFEDMLGAVLISHGFDQRRQDGHLAVFRSSDPGAPVLPLAEGAPRAEMGAISEAGSGHIPHEWAREAEWVLARSALVGLVAIGDEWKALILHPNGFLALTGPGMRFFDAQVESVGSKGLVARATDGKRIELRLTPAAPGIVRRPPASTR